MWYVEWFTNYGWLTANAQFVSGVFYRTGNLTRDEAISTASKLPMGFRYRIRHA